MLPPHDGRESHTPEDKRPWEPIRLTYLGNVADLLEASHGKLSHFGQDPGDARPLKPRGQG